MCTWPELHTCTVFMKRKSIKENQKRVNTLLNQFTYKLKEKRNKIKNTKKDKTEQNKIYLTYLIWKEKKKKHTGDALEY